VPCRKATLAIRFAPCFPNGFRSKVPGWLVELYRTDQAAGGGNVQGYETLKKDLDKGKKFMMAGWSRREKYHEQIMFGVHSMGRDLQGIVGEAMPEIESLEAVQLGEPISLPAAESKSLQLKELAAD
jgi:hypothetical protein